MYSISLLCSLLSPARCDAVSTAVVFCDIERRLVSVVGLSVKQREELWPLLVSAELALFCILFSNCCTVFPHAQRCGLFIYSAGCRW